MWALRWRTRKEGYHRPAYWLVDSPFDSGDQILTLRNLGITAIEMNLPHQRDTGHFFFAYAEAFRTLFGEELKAVRSMQDDREIVDRRRMLVSYPTLVAIGLSAKNLAGCPEQEDLSLRREGRKNMLFKDPDEYAGGSALTAVGVCSKLCNSYKERVEGAPLPHCALVSMIGRDDAERGPSFLL